MAKRFVDTEIFKDEWFIELSQDGKLFWLYYITNCDHAGILKFSPRHVTFCTGILDVDKVIKEFANRLVTVRVGLFWMPNFIKFQYPNFPNTKMKAALSALEILQKLNIDLNSYVTVTEQLPNSYGNGNGIGNGMKGVIGENPPEPKSFEKQIFYNIESIKESTHWEELKRYVYQKTMKDPIRDSNYIADILLKYDLHLEERRFWTIGLTPKQFGAGLAKWVLNEKNFAK